MKGGLVIDNCNMLNVLGWHSTCSLFHRIIQLQNYLMQLNCTSTNVALSSDLFFPLTKLLSPRTHLQKLYQE
jgi:hypothetical protein